jgi:hypothetical protein
MFGPSLGNCGVQITPMLSAGMQGFKAPCLGTLILGTLDPTRTRTATCYAPTQAGQHTQSHHSHITNLACLSGRPGFGSLCTRHRTRTFAIKVRLLLSGGSCFGKGWRMSSASSLSVVCLSVCRSLSDNVTVAVSVWLSACLSHMYTYAQTHTHRHARTHTHAHSLSLILTVRFRSFNSIAAPTLRCNIINTAYLPGT